VTGGRGLNFKRAATSALGREKNVLCYLLERILPHILKRIKLFVQLDSKGSPSSSTHFPNASVALKKYSGT
jgi:hypothetical protein